MNADDIAARFERDTAEHELTVLHDDGLYRHLRVAQPGNSEYWYDLVTWPGCLAVRGDFGDDWIFSRQRDMFEFFRRDRINPHYWAQKTERGRDSCRVYDEAAFRQRVTEAFVGAVRDSDAPRGLGRALRADVLDFDLSTEDSARKLLEDFEFEGFRFEDTWEWDFREYDPAYLWSCHAIVEGIRRYDLHRAAEAEKPTEPRVVCICGSTRFMAEMAEEAVRLTLSGCIVVGPVKTPRELWARPAGAEALKVGLDALHKAKIRMADEVFVVAPGGYIGDSTWSEIVYAEQLGKPVTYSSPEAIAEVERIKAARDELADIEAEAARLIYADPLTDTTETQ